MKLGGQWVENEFNVDFSWNGFIIICNNLFWNKSSKSTSKEWKEKMSYSHKRKDNLSITTEKQLCNHCGHHKAFSKFGGLECCRCKKVIEVKKR